jgi:quercetin dioxygenase-like cupin family protein
MEVYRLENMVKGWFVGAFSPTVLKTNDCEIAVKRYQQGDYEKNHYHQLATEITVVIEGLITMCGKDWKAGDIIKLAPGEQTDFLAITNAVTVVVKHPGALNDKYLVE